MPRTRTRLLTLPVSAVALLACAAAAPAAITAGPGGNAWFAHSAFPAKGAGSKAPQAELEVDQDNSGHGSNDHTSVLQATIDANRHATTYHVEYGDDGAYGSRSSEQWAGVGRDPVDYVVELPLQPGGPYHARVVATSLSGMSASADLAFWVTAAGEISRSGPGNSGHGGGDDGEDNDTPAPTATPTPAPTAPTAPAGPDEADDPPAAPAPAPPVLGRNVAVRPLAGSVRFRAPGKSGFAPLGSRLRVPVGSIIDTRGGRVSLQSARGAHGRTQTGVFWGALFQVRQRRHGRGVTDLVLHGGSFAHCGVRAGASALAREAGGRRHVIRRLWGKDRHARFRTHGRDSVATVRGTEWVTTDRCDGTLTKVRKGAVLVRDVHRKRSVLLTAGHSYFAHHH